MSIFLTFFLLNFDIATLQSTHFFLILYIISFRPLLCHWIDVEDVSSLWYCFWTFLSSYFVASFLVILCPWISLRIFLCLNIDFILSFVVASYSFISRSFFCPWNSVRNIFFCAVILISWPLVSFLGHSFDLELILERFYALVLLQFTFSSRVMFSDTSTSRQLFLYADREVNQRLSLMFFTFTV